MRRREIKKVWIVMKLLLKQGAISKHQKVDIENVDRGIRETMGLLTNETIPLDQILGKREKLEQNAELKEVFTMFWLVLSPHVIDGVLSKEGYLKFNILIQRALLGTLLEDEHMKFAEDDYTHDTYAYGPITETAFYDVMIEVIETWSEMLNPRFYAAFAWALLGSIVNINSRPPKFKPLKHVECITKVDNENDILTKFSTEKKNRANVKLHTEWLSSSSMRPEVQKRLLERRHAQTLNRDKSDMLELVNREIEHFDHSDEESSVASLSTKVTHRAAPVIHDDTFDSEDVPLRQPDDDMSVDSTLLKRLHSGVNLEKPHAYDNHLPAVSILSLHEGSDVFDANFSLQEGSVESLLSNNLSGNGGSSASLKRNSISFNTPGMNTSRHSADTHSTSRGSRVSRHSQEASLRSRGSRERSASSTAASRLSSHLGVDINTFDTSLNDWIDQAQSFLAKEYISVTADRISGENSVSTTSSGLLLKIDGLHNPTGRYPSTMWNPRRALKQYKSSSLPPELKVARRGKVPPRKDEIVTLTDAMEYHEKKSKKTKNMLSNIAIAIERNSSVETCIDKGVTSDDWLTTVPIKKPLGPVLADVRHAHTYRKQVSQEHIPKSPHRMTRESVHSAEDSGNFFLTGQGTASSSLSTVSNVHTDDNKPIPALTISTMNVPMQSLSVPSLDESESPIYKNYRRINHGTSSLQSHPTPGPWIPHGAFDVMLSDKKHKLLNWREQRDIMRNFPVDNTMHRTILKRQDVVRNALENYLSKSEPALAPLRIG